MTELSAYAFSPLQEDAFSLYRGSGNDLDPILLVVPTGQYAADESLIREESAHAAKLVKELNIRPDQ